MPTASWLALYILNKLAVNAEFATDASVLYHTFYSPFEITVTL